MRKQERKYILKRLEGIEDQTTNKQILANTRAITTLIQHDGIIMESKGYGRIIGKQRNRTERR